MKLFLLMLIAVSGLNLYGQTKLTQEEYAVYASVLKAIYKENRETHSNKSEFVFLNETKVDPELELPSGKRYGNLVKNFIQQNSASAIIEKKFPRGAYAKSYYLASQAEISALFEEGRIEAEKQRAEKERIEANSNLKSISIEIPTAHCVPFYQKYPESGGYYSFSRVGFSGRLAMFQLKEDLCWNGFSRTYILKRVKDKWEIITFEGSQWIS